jgi:hypothetical protein
MKLTLMNLLVWLIFCITQCLFNEALKLVNLIIYLANFEDFSISGLKLCTTRNEKFRQMCFHVFGQP